MAHQPSILIVGGGAFGTSSAYHLSRRGYTRVTVLDRFAAPSKDAAATDLNKIVRFDYPNPLYSRLGLEAMKIWEASGNLFSGLFRRTGWIMGAHEMTAGFLQSSYETSKSAGREGVKFIDIPEMKKMFPQFTGDFPGWTNLWSPQAGWVRRSLLPNLRLDDEADHIQGTIRSGPPTHGNCGAGKRSQLCHWRCWLG